MQCAVVLIKAFFSACDVAVESEGSVHLETTCMILVLFMSVQ